jgi:hypothetical protein
LKLVKLKAALNTGLSEKFKEAFPKIEQLIKPKIGFTGIKDLN